MGIDLDLKFPAKLQCLFKPSRYKVLYGGRGGAKSWGVATALLVKGMENKIRVLCAREMQTSIRDSVHKLLSDRINDLGLSGFYTITQNSIKGKNGTEFGFEGLKFNVTNIKSYEGADIAWVEEAQVVSKSSWDVLIPTIRKENSEIWITFNPDLEEDETYQRFVIHPPENAQVVKINWPDNPWFPEVLKEEMEHLKKVDPDAWLNVWEGHCRKGLEGAVYAQELRLAEEEDRITSVPYDKAYPVHTYWDLGYADHTSIWFAQWVGKECRVIDFYENQFQSIQHYLDVLNNKPYTYGTDYLPHDAQSKQLGTGKSIEELVRQFGRRVDIIKRDKVTNGIAATRSLFSRIWFDKVKCADGISALRRYRYEQDQNGQWKKEPKHDEYSHAADALRYMGMSTQHKEKQEQIPYRKLAIV